jgi:galactonate dehydratase
MLSAWPCDRSHNVRITDVKSFSAPVGGRNQLLVKVETDEGVYGWGEAGLSSRELAVEGAFRHYREFLIGRDPMQRGRIWQELYRSQYFEGGRVLTAAISAVDIALHDLVGKHLGVPVYELLGGRQRDFVQLFATAGGASVDEALDHARLLVADGWSVVRFGILPPAADDPAVFEPRESLALNAELLVRAREELGPRTVIGIDYHHRLSVAEAASFCQMLPPHTIDFLEEPVRDETPQAYEALRRMTAIPFAIGEEFASKWQFLPYVERDILSFARIDVCNVGGLTEAMKVAGWCEAHYVDLMPHNPLGPVCTAASAHLATAVPNMAWLEIFETRTEERGQFYDREIYPVQPGIDGDRLVLADRPGLGVEVDEAALDESFRFAEFPHLRRLDGSVTNW